ncbi:MAG: alpha/beta hydrolase [Leptospira sp.]|nr:alpha/beta hydrolase [Leptospira sp.]NCS93430.1 alpha/beta hydrolase [Leptospira sp.]
MKYFFKSTKILNFLFLILIQFHCASTILPIAIGWERGKADLEKKAIQVDEFKIVYLEGGNPKGETVLFVHGFGADKDNWTRISKFFADDYHLVLVDLPGFGESDRIQELEYSHITQSNRLKKFVDLLGLKSFHIIGNSMGGAISGQFAFENPNLVRSIVFLNAAGVKSPNPSDLSKELAAGRNPLIVESPEEFDRLINYTMVKPPYIPGPIKTYFGERAIANADFNKKILKDYRSIAYPLDPILSKINQQALVIWGDTDRVIDVSSTEVFEKKLKQSKIVIMKDCGHAPMIERPEETAGYILAFLSNLQ